MRLENQDYDYDSPVWTGQATTGTIDQLTDNTYYFVVRAYSGSVESTDSNEVEFKVVINTAPTAEAGADQAVSAGTDVTLDGTGSSDAEGNIAAYQWTQTSGPSVTLADSAAAQSSFSAPAVSSNTTLGFSLRVEDAQGLSDTDTCQVTVVPTSTGPTDSDNDGLSDADETDIYGTDPYNPDSDGDGIADGQEIADGTDPTVNDSGSNEEMIWLEAENGILSAPMSKEANDAASASVSICVPQGEGSIKTPSAQAGYAEYTFEIQSAGSYRIWARVLAPSGRDDSFFVAMDNEEFVRWNTQRDTQWVWDQVGTTGSDPLVYNLESGEHTFYVMQREDGTHLDKLLITADTEFIPTGTGPEVVDAAPVDITHVEMEAESGIMSYPMQVEEGSDASSGAFVWVPNGTGGYSSPSDSAGIAEYVFEVTEEGDYFVWGRVMAPSGKDDSFFVAMDDDNFVRWNTARGLQWTWDQVNSYQGDDPVIYHLTAGEHTFYLMQREDGTAIDRIIVTNNSEFNPE